MLEKYKETHILGKKPAEIFSQKKIFTIERAKPMSDDESCMRNDLGIALKHKVSFARKFIMFLLT